MKGDRERKRTFMLITIPILALFICFNTLPLIKGFIYSFTNFKGYGSYDWVGARNYVDLFTDGRVGRSYLFTFKYAIVGTILTNVISLVIALGLNSKIKGKSVLRGIYFIPNVLGGLVIGYIFSFFFTYILPVVGQSLGIEALSGSMLSSTSQAWIAIVIVGCWQAIAMNTIIYISGLQTVPEDIYEAADMGGCGTFRKFFTLTLPYIKPTIIMTILLRTIWIFNSFDLVVIVTEGGPANYSQTLPSYMYTQAFSSYDFGLAGAFGVLLMVILTLYALIFLKITQYDKAGDF